MQNNNPPTVCMHLFEKSVDDTKKLPHLLKQYIVWDILVSEESFISKTNKTWLKEEFTSKDEKWQSP